MLERKEVNENVSYIIVIIIMLQKKEERENISYTIIIIIILQKKEEKENISYTIIIYNHHHIAEEGKEREVPISGNSSASSAAH